MKQYNPSDYEENQEIQAIVEQLKSIETDLEMSEKNSKMFYRLWIQWSQEEDNLKGRQGRLRAILKNKIPNLKNTPQ